MRMEIPVFKNGSLLEVRLKETDCTDMIYTFQGAVFLKDEKVMEGSLMVMEVSDERFKILTSGAD